MAGDDDLRFGDITGSRSGGSVGKVERITELAIRLMVLAVVLYAFWHILMAMIPTLL